MGNKPSNKANSSEVKNLPLAKSLPVMENKGKSTSFSDPRKRIMSDLLLNHGSYGIPESSLLSQLFVNYFSQTSTDPSAYQEFAKELAVFRIYGDAAQKEAAKLFSALSPSEIERYAKMASKVSS